MQSQNKINSALRADTRKLIPLAQDQICTQQSRQRWHRTPLLTLPEHCIKHTLGTLGVAARLGTEMAFYLARTSPTSWPGSSSVTAARRRRRGWRRRPRTPAAPLVQSSHTEAARRAGRTGSPSVSNVRQPARLPGADESRVDDGRRRGAAAGRRSGGYSARVRSGQRPSGSGVASRGQADSRARQLGPRGVAESLVGLGLG